MVTQPVPKTSLLTVENLEQIESDERFELIRGECADMSPTTYLHGRISGRIAGSLSAFATPKNLGDVIVGEAGFVLRRDPDTVVVPDVSFIRADRVPDMNDQRRFADLVPDIVVEVLSPSDRASRVTDKVMLYLEAGAKLVWVVDADRRIVMVYRAADPSTARILREGDELDGEDVLPGFQTPVSQIFA